MGEWRELGRGVGQQVGIWVGTSSRGEMGRLGAGSAQREAVRCAVDGRGGMRRERKRGGEGAGKRGRGLNIGRELAC